MSVLEHCRFTQEISRVVVPMSRHVYLDTLPNHTRIFRVIVPMSRYVYLDTLSSHIGFTLCITSKDDYIIYAC